MANRIEKIKNRISSQEWEEIKEYISQKDYESLFDYAEELKTSSFHYIYGYGAEEEEKEELRILILLLIKDMDGPNNVFFEKAFCNKAEGFNMDDLEKFC